MQLLAGPREQNYYVHQIRQGKIISDNLKRTSKFRSIDAFHVIKAIFGRLYTFGTEVLRRKTVF